MRNNGRTGHVTLAAALWPAVGVVIVNTDVFAAMTDDQRGVFRTVVDNGRPRTADYAEVEAEALADLCRTGKGVHVVTQAERGALRTAVQPVYDDLNRTRNTATYISEIQAIAASTRTDQTSPPNTCTD